MIHLSYRKGIENSQNWKFWQDKLGIIVTQVKESWKRWIWMSCIAHKSQKFVILHSAKTDITKLAQTNDILVIVFIKSLRNHESFTNILRTDIWKKLLVNLCSLIQTKTGKSLFNPGIGKIFRFLSVGQHLRYISLDLMLKSSRTTNFSIELST